MDLTPSQISGATFRTVRKGYDSAEVEALLNDAAAALEQAQQQATAMEARARAAVARLQEQQQAAPAQPTPVAATTDDAETISRTLLLAQRTADTTIAEAQSEAERIRTTARAEADSTLDSTREMSSQLVEQARAEARKATETERVAAADEVESLKARREFLLGDVDQLEQFLIDQRERLRGAARQIEALCDRVPSGLGQVTPPVVSASNEVSDRAGDDAGHDAGELMLPPEAQMPFAGPDELADVLGDTPLSDGSINRDIDTGELDVTQALNAVNAPELPVRRHPGDDETHSSN